MISEIFIDELERDALTEIVNIGVSRAAANLRKMVGHQVLLSVPLIDVVSQERAARLISEREISQLVSVRQDFKGAFSGRALLILPHEKSLELVRAVTQNELDDAELVEIEHEALTEISNIILNSCLATMANMLRQPLTMTIPVVTRWDSTMSFEVWNEAPPDAPVLFLYINFSVQNRNIGGYIAILMSIPSLVTLKELIAAFIERVIGNND
jgi:chemotaxis protein CheC